MRILIAAPYREIVGGAQTYQKALFAVLRARGHAVALAYESPIRSSCDVVDGRDPSDARFSVGDLGVEAACREIESWRPDVVYSQGTWSGHLEASLLGRYPCVLFAHDYYGTCATGTKHHWLPASRVCERALGPACLILNYTSRCGGVDPLRLLRGYHNQTGRRDRLHSYAKVLVASHHMVREYERHGVCGAQIERLPLFGTIEADAELAKAPDPNGVVLFASRLVSLKGGALLVDAIAHGAQVLGRSLTLVVAGDGPDRAMLEARAHAARVPARFLGWLDVSGVEQAIRGAELLAIPSVWPEPFGLMGIEAGGLGVPAVGFAVGGITDWLRGGESGEIAPGDTPSAGALAGAIVRALRDRSHYERLREGAWQSARSYSREGHVARLEAVLAQVAGYPGAVA